MVAQSSVQVRARPTLPTQADRPSDSTWPNWPTDRPDQPTTDRPTDRPDPTRPRSRGTIQWIVLKNNNNILILYNFPLYCTARPRGLGPLGDLRDVGSGFLHLQRPNDAVSSRAGRGEPQYFYCTPSSLKIGGNYLHFFQGVGAGKGDKTRKTRFWINMWRTCDRKAWTQNRVLYQNYDTLRHLQYKSQDDGWLRRALPEHCVFEYFPPFSFGDKTRKTCFRINMWRNHGRKAWTSNHFLYHNYDTLRHIVGTTKKHLKNNLRFFRGPDLPRMHF